MPDKKSPSQKERWFFKVETLEDATKAIELSCKIYYAIAGIMTLVILFVGYSTGTGLMSLLDPVLMVVLAFSISKWKSRTAAIFLMMHAVFISSLTIGNRMGVNLIEGGLGGKNFILAAFAIFAAYKAIQGSFRYHSIRQEQDPEYRAVRRGAYFVWVPLGLIGVMLASLMVLGLTTPTTAVITGDELSESDLKLLRVERIVEPREDIILFYSAGLFSIREDGSVITDRRIISYEEFENEVLIASANFGEIADVSIVERGGLWSDTILAVTRVDGERFLLLISIEEDGDERFLKELRKRMK